MALLIFQEFLFIFLEGKHFKISSYPEKNNPRRE